jgi:hypothetical protein
MNTIDYFKLQAKNLHKDFKSKIKVFDPTTNKPQHEYTPRYFDIEMIISDFDIDENNFTLMNAQHIIAKIANFKSWADLLKVSNPELQLAKLLYDYQNRVDIYDWQNYIAESQKMNDIKLDFEIQIEIFNQVVIEEDIFQIEYESYLLKHKFHA